MQMLLRLCLIILAVSNSNARACELDRPIKFAGLDWDSAQFIVEVVRVISERGYGCKTESLPGSSLPMLTGMMRGDIDVMMEVWKENIAEAWAKGVEEGRVLSLGVTFSGANQGFFVPRYVIEGDKQRGIEPLAPNLKSVADLPHYAQLFQDREEPSKGRFYNCILGWSCERINNRKFIAYRMEDHYTNFHPGTSASLSAAIESAYIRGQPILTYYWEPTWIMGKYDMVQLAEPPYDETKWATLDIDDESTTIEAQGCAYPITDVYTGVSSEFAATAPELAKFLTQFELTSKMVSQYLAYIKSNDASHRAAAIQFLTDNEALWRSWVPPEVASKVSLEHRKKLFFPEVLQIDITTPINDFVDHIVAEHGSSFDTISGWLLSFLLVIEGAFRDLPWWLFLILVTGLTAFLTRKIRFTVAIALAFCAVGSLGLWDMAMQTLALMLVATTISVVIGLPTGVAMAYSPRFRMMMTPVLDMMQTMPSFVYLIPALMLFGLGKVPALFATLIYGLPPLIRLTDLGIRLVDKNVLEAAEAFGVSSRYRLFGIQLPLALPNIMAGINQTTMMSLSMVVIASMIGARGLGEQVLIGIQRLDVGQGAEAGIAIVILAITLDRITQHLGKNRYPAQEGA